MNISLAHKLGYLLLTTVSGEETLVKANKIFSILPREEGEGSHISIGVKTGVVVVETPEEVMAQISELHPSLR